MSKIKDLEAQLLQAVLIIQELKAGLKSIEEIIATDGDELTDGECIDLIIEKLEKL